MSLAATLRARLDRSFGLYRDLTESLDEVALASRLPGIPSNTIGLQLWCVVGARESYVRAIEAGEWCGFSCSLESTTEQASVAGALARSATALGKCLASIDSFDEIRGGLLVDLLEHEAAHQGQLIRYLYGLRLPIPGSWKARYALT
jgi:hypothetical protein